MNPDILITGSDLLEKALDKVYGDIQKTAEVAETIDNITVVSGDEDNQEVIDLSPDKASDEDAPIVKLVNLIFQESIKERATDIHIEPIGKTGLYSNSYRRCTSNYHDASYCFFEWFSNEDKNSIKLKYC